MDVKKLYFKSCNGRKNEDEEKPFYNSIKLKGRKVFFPLFL